MKIRQWITQYDLSNKNKTVNYTIQFILEFYLCGCLEQKKVSFMVNVIYRSLKYKEANQLFLLTEAVYDGWPDRLGLHYNSSVGP